MLRSDLCDSSDPYVAVKRTIDLLATFANENDKDQKNAAFKNNAHFRSWISKLNYINRQYRRSLYSRARCNLLEYSQNYSMTSGSL